MSYVKFEIKQFSSGEFDVKIVERIYGEKAVIHWNWFDKSQRDVFSLLLKVDSIKRNYPNLPIVVDAPYLPYMRQDRLFTAGQSVPATKLIDLLLDSGVSEIRTLACHSKQSRLSCNNILDIPQDTNYLAVFPDANAQYHYAAESSDALIFSKIREENGSPKLGISQKPIHISYNKFVIFDDIVAGGRTFIECATALREEYFEKKDMKIELTVYHAFLDFGIDKLKEAGIQKINIINKDSYDYILNLYPNDKDYFSFVKIN